MASRNSPLTDAKIKNLKAESGERTEIGDPGCPGLRVRISSKSKTFVWYYRTGNKIKRRTLGTYPTKTLKQARQDVLELRAKHQDGISISPTEGTPRTVKDLAEIFYEKRIFPHRKAPHIVKQILNHDIIPEIGAKRLSSLSTPTVAAVVDKMVNRGAVAHAGKCLGVMKQMFKFAQSRGWIESNPAEPLDKKDLGVVENVRDRNLDLDEIKILWDVLETVKGPSPNIRYGLRILLLTGVRSGELHQAKWADVDLEKRLWTVPVTSQKLTRGQAQKAKAFLVPLSSLAVEQFELLKETSQENGGWVLPGIIEGKPLGDKVMARALKRLLEVKDKEGNHRLPIEPFTPHDLRRTLRSNLSRLRIPPHVAEKCLNHSLGRIISVYDHETYLDERREALEKWADCVDLAVNPRENVAQLGAAL